MKQKVAIFDIDGTIFRSSLLIELTDGLIQARIFPFKAAKQYQAVYRQWLDRRDSYEKYIEAVVTAFMKYLRGVRHSDFIRVASKVAAFHQNRVYRYTRDLVADLKKRRYFLLAVSNSPKEILDEFCRRLGFDKVYGRIYQLDSRSRFTGQTEYLDLISDKARILQRAVAKHNLSLKNSIGVGDTENDIAFLRLVERPICFNPNKKLHQYAKKHGWEIVVERKDVVYFI